MKPLRTQPEAAEELNHAAGWYEQRRPGLGLRFLASTDVTLNKVRRFPGAGVSVPRAPADLHVRRAPISGFPYHVVYLETADAIHVLAFAHDKRRPFYWVSRTDAGPPTGA